LTPEQALDTKSPLPHSKLWGITINKEQVEAKEVAKVFTTGFNLLNEEILTAVADRYQKHIKR